MCPIYFYSNSPLWSKDIQMVHKSFFEYLGIADVERIHSQTIAWIFSDNCMAIDKKYKRFLLQDLFSLKSGTVVSIQTERSGIDILIETTSEVLIIENKIKSSQHSNQLDKYQSYCDKNFPDLTKHYYYLTLIGEKPDNKIWKHVSYGQLYDKLKLAPITSDNSHAVIITEYLMYLDRLTTVLRNFNSTPEKFDMVFLDGHKKKEDKIDANYKNDDERFIAANQLETTLQRCFLSVLAKRITITTGLVSKPRGQALIDFPIQDSIDYQGKKYTTFMQLQGDTIKFAFSLDTKHHRETESKKALIAEIIPKMKKLSEGNEFGYKKLNIPKSNAYVSISKRLKWHYWHKNTKELAEFITAEICKGKTLTKQLMALVPGLSILRTGIGQSQVVFCRTKECRREEQN